MRTSASAPDRDDKIPDLARLLRKHEITQAQVMRLRATDLAVGLRSLDEAALLLAIETGPARKCREWGDFLVETMLDFLLWDQRPSGTLSEEQATWLCDQVGARPTPACMALLVALLDEAHAVPAWFQPAVRVRAAKVFATGPAELQAA